MTAQQTIQRFRVKETHWTRQRCLTFDTTATLILQGHKFPMQNNLNKLFQAMNQVEDVPTASAYCQARRKLKPELFLYLNQQVTDGFYDLYGGDGQVRRWQGRRVLGVDGTYLNLPDSEETRQRFSVQMNQHDAQGWVQAMASVLYDVRNDIGLNAALSGRCAEKTPMFDHHLKHTQKGDVVVLDRLYADFAVMAFWAGNGRDFVIRMPRGRFQEVQAFWASSEREREVRLKATGKQKRFVRERGLPTSLRVRLVKVELDSGETEVLATSLLDRHRYEREGLKEVYGWRWGVETYVDRLKNIFEVERFSGQSVRSIEQDFYGVVFLATLESVLSKGAEAALVEEGEEREWAYEPQVNHSVSYSALLDYVVELFMDVSKDEEETLAELERLFRTNPTWRREGRKYPRRKLTPSQQVRFYRYRKRVCA